MFFQWLWNSPQTDQTSQTSQNAAVQAPQQPPLNQNLLNQMQQGYLGLGDLYRSIIGADTKSVETKMVLGAEINDEQRVKLGDIGLMTLAAGHTGSMELIELMTQHGIPLTQTDYDNRLPVMFAAANITKVELGIFEYLLLELLEKHPSKNINDWKTKSGRTLAHAVCMSYVNVPMWPQPDIASWIASIELLKAKGVDFSVKDNFGLTPTDYLYFFIEYKSNNPEEDLPKLLEAIGNVTATKPEFTTKQQLLTPALDGSRNLEDADLAKIQEAYETQQVSAADLCSPNINGFGPLHLIQKPFQQDDNSREQVQFYARIAKQHDIDITYAAGNSKVHPLHIQAHRGNLEAFKAIIEEFPVDDISSILDADGRNVAHALFLQTASRPNIGYEQAVEFAKYFHDLPNGYKLFSTKDKYGFTPCDYGRAWPMGLNLSYTLGSIWSENSSIVEKQPAASSRPSVS